VRRFAQEHAKSTTVLQRPLCHHGQNVGLTSTPFESMQTPLSAPLLQV
jgi:hypothetical protein